MQLRIKGTTEVFHVESSLGRALLAIKDSPVEIPTPPKPKPFFPRTTWSIEQGLITGTPAIYAHCATCSKNAHITGRTAHLTQKFAHCGVQENVPPDMAQAWEKVLAGGKVTEDILEEPRPRYIKLGQ